MNTSSSFKFVKFFLKLLILHFWMTGLNTEFFPDASTLTVVVEVPYPIPLLSMLTEVIVPDELTILEKI